jgi:protein-tyrosine phosphatase
VNGPFRVLHVCTGNIGRSPMAERLMRARLAKVLGDGASSFVVDSAGTWGHTGSPMEPFAATALAVLGVSPDGFAARELAEEHVRSADLVLTATTEHRTTVVGLVPGALHRTFTLRELARLAPAVEPGLEPGLDPVTRAHEAVAAAVVARGREPRPVDPADDDVADPIGAPVGFYLDRAAEIDDACVQVVGLLVGTRR